METPRPSDEEVDSNPEAPLTQAEQIALANDQLRQRGIGGRIMVTQAIQQLEPETRLQLLLAVRDYEGFSDDNNPYGERDFGSVEIEGKTYYWKVDLYDPSFTAASPDPVDPRVTRRVMTLMRADEY